MPEIGAYEAKTRFSEILRRVERGERCVVACRVGCGGVLEPGWRGRRRDVKEVIRDILEFGQKHSLGGLKIKDLIEEGRM